MCIRDSSYGIMEPREEESDYVPPENISLIICPCTAFDRECRRKMCIRDRDGRLVTSGGRVLGVTETADTLEAAVKKAYETVDAVDFANAYYRKDIGKRALMAERN